MLIHLIRIGGENPMKIKLFALLLALCLVMTASAEISVTDMFGREITLDAPATRIVALSAADCEILCALDCEDKLVGVGAYCNHPASIQSLPVVESGAETNIEQILMLAPQIVIMADMAQTVEQVNMLQNAGIQVVVNHAVDIAGTYNAIRIIGQVTGKDAEAEALIAEMETAFQTIAEQSHDTKDSVYFEVSPLQWGLWTAGKGTFMDELAALCGLTNIFADVEGWAAVSEEQVMLRNPDYIVTISEFYSEGPTPVEEIMQRAGWDSIGAVSNHKIFNANSDMVSRPGPRLVEAAQALFDFVHE